MSTPKILTELVDQPIDLAALAPTISDADVGAHGWFLGVTRRTTGDRVTERLCYEAHRSMAAAELQRLAARACAQFELAAAVIVHRLGEVAVGQASVVVGCSSGHRPQVFAALPWIMDQLKRDVPIWKQETYADGTTEWVHPQS